MPVAVLVLVAVLVVVLVVVLVLMVLTVPVWGEPPRSRAALALCVKDDAAVTVAGSDGLRWRPCAPGPPGFLTE